MIKNFFKNKSILITGGTGSLGKKYVEFLLKNFKLKKIIIFSRDELKQSIMSQELSSTKYGCLRYFLGDVRDIDRLNMAMQDVDYVLHAAALKHVNIAEYNPFEFIKTNILGAENVVKAAIANNVKKVIALSTDKAVDPINLYGATKLTSDKIFISSNNIVGSKKVTRFSVVRYGNVIGSRGSVIPFFNDLAKKKEKALPITDVKMTRFLMTMEMAIELVIYALKNGQNGDLFIQKTPSCTIKNLVDALKEVLNLKNYPINIIGERHGEKFHETLMSREESAKATSFKNYFLIKSDNRSLNYKLYFEKGKVYKKIIEAYSSENARMLDVNSIKKYLQKLNLVKKFKLT